MIAVVAIEVRIRIDDIEVADLALHGERRLRPAVVEVLGIEVRDLEIADVRIERVDALRVLVLRRDGRRDRPVLVEIDLERRAPALRVDVVVVVLARRWRCRRRCPTSDTCACHARCR